MQISARVDYAVRALIELAGSPGILLSRDDIAGRQGIPRRYLEAVLGMMSTEGLVVGHRGATGGYALGRPASEISVAEVARCVDGPLTVVNSVRPEQVRYSGNSAGLETLWIGVRAALRSVLESVTIADLAAGALPPHVQALVTDPDAWLPRPQPRGDRS